VGSSPLEEQMTHRITQTLVRCKEMGKKHSPA
jgi:hypothetical protein